MNSIKKTVTQCTVILPAEAEFKEFKPCRWTAKNRFQLSAGSNLETLNTISSETNHVWRFEPRLKLEKWLIFFSIQQCLVHFTLGCPDWTVVRLNAYTVHVRTAWIMQQSWSNVGLSGCLLIKPCRYFNPRNLSFLSALSYSYCFQLISDSCNDFSCIIKITDFMKHWINFLGGKVFFGFYLVNNPSLTESLGSCEVSDPLTFIWSKYVNQQTSHALNVPHAFQPCRIN